MIGRLERNGLVQRMVDPTDARARRVMLTRQGRSARKKFLTHLGDGSAALGQLSTSQQAELRLLLNKTDELSGQPKRRRSAVERR